MVRKMLILALFCASLAPSYGQENDSVTVLHMKVQANIDPRTNRYTELGLEKAKEIEADYVILELDTYGGALNDADEIRTRILEFDIPIYAYINKDAASAGALISIACDSIYMASGSSIGAATVVTQDGAAAPDKYQSYMRSIMRSTAEATGRDPKIAEGMVDEDIEVDSISAEGKVITLSVSEAIKFGFCEAEVESLKDIMLRSEVEDFEVVEFNLDWSEKVIALFLNPFVSGILILIIIGGIYFELQTPGVGFPILASIIAAILYFIPYYMNGLAENWEIVVFVIGVVLIAVEVFVIPGFGIAGITGLVMTIGALILVMLNNDAFDFQFVDPTEIFYAISSTMLALLGSIVLMFYGGIRLTDSKLFNRIALVDTQDQADGYTSSFYKEKVLVGKTGEAYTNLRPSGKVMIDEEIYDAYTRGNYIEAKSKIEVVSDEGTSLKVKEIKG